jgi:hypothetical protein
MAGGSDPAGFFCPRARRLARGFRPMITGTQLAPRPMSIGLAPAGIAGGGGVVLAAGILM